jgi:glycosyltransferase involved in cell wall biosynthesis
MSENEVEVLRQALQDAQAQLRAIHDSTLWRLTRPLREIGHRSPQWARRLRRVSEAFRGADGAPVRPTQAPPAPVPVSPESQSAALPAGRPLPEVRLLSETGIVADPARADYERCWPNVRPLVTVVIPCFNYGHLVREAIRSVEAQTFQSLEIIVVEGGSTRPESRRLMEEAVAEVGSRRLQIVYQDRPHRAGANRNFGISHAQGKYVCCLDADDRLAPTFIEKAVFLLEYGGYDVVSTSLQYFGDRSDVWYPDPFPDVDRLLEGNFVLTCGVFRHALWHRAGGYRDSDPTTGHVHEDWIFWQRLAALGARMTNIQEPLFYYRSHGQTLSNRDNVIGMEAQRALVRRFNADVLTAEALQAAREVARSTPAPQAMFYAGWKQVPMALDGPRPVLLLAVPFLILGGAERLLSAITAHLAGSGWRILIVSTVEVDSATTEVSHWFSEATEEIFHLPKFASPHLWRDFIDYLVASRGVDVFWVVGSAVAYEQLPQLRRRFGDLRVVDLLFNTVGHVANNRRYADCIDLTFVESAPVADWLEAAGESRDRIAIVRSGVDLRTYRPNAAESSDAATDGPPESVRVGFFGRWSEEKDPIGFVRIAKLLSAESDLQFLMTGSGPLESAIQAEVGVADLPAGRFTIVGAVPEVAPYLRNCDVVVVPSRLDGRPNIVMEALASGAAVVASSVGAIPEMVVDGECGFLCPPGDYTAFAARIRELLVDRTLLKRLQRSARKVAEQRFDRQTMLRDYEARLSRLVREAAVRTESGQDTP